MNFNCCKTKKSKQDLKRTVGFLKVIAEENRLKILCILRKQEMCVCEIWQHLGLPQNLASHHLKVLKDLGLVEHRKESTKVLYSVNQKVINKYSSLLSGFIINI
ncbi:metalloregulator ArsR/SmtB family transcription factor [Patescibacteria group bacterium]|nr:winged helix-turn-helix transcriptional regulator [Candidatus Falkowbacteria bacterium]MBU3906420.1 metalloregulator ArsR/SmtB family transcription factor [Patescibacteria group bacterium]MCG2698747.1 metalloregulator ArsR/SmtB family transcription factor [Candidatus Parcubacteria bacterium]MBU4014873.1 metalloregulator ArsR/SmtB family transcription factor [Patescibacteria group bacterium]MBU4026850.1 metalloregulator ArsR/SmtB family transcription factor [Patescibacteria group bacterium]